MDEESYQDWAFASQLFRNGLGEFPEQGLTPPETIRQAWSDLLQDMPVTVQFPSKKDYTNFYSALAMYRLREKRVLESGPFPVEILPLRSKKLKGAQLRYKFWLGPLENKTFYSFVLTDSGVTDE